MTQKAEIIEQTWLHYFNDYLFNTGCITEDQRNKMKNKITSLKKQ